MKIITSSVLFQNAINKAMFITCAPKVVKN